jgi:NitT/TauT family transport system ATP-binding protein
MRNDGPIEPLNMGPDWLDPGERELEYVYKLRVEGLCRDFSMPGGEAVRALDSIDLKVTAGELLCIVGPSGCGKSTLLNLMAGLDTPTSGQIWLDGHAVSGPAPDLSVIFQELGLFPWLTVRQNVEFGLKMRGIAKEERRERVQVYLRLVHLSRFGNSYVHQLSGGMKQRVALARSLVLQPGVLFMDEPFAALDAQTRDLLHEELERLWSQTGQTIVFVTHNVREAIRLANRVVLLTFRPGRVKTVFPVHLVRPRHMEDTALARLAGEVQELLKEEIAKAVKEEYQHAPKN